MQKSPPPSSHLLASEELFLLPPLLLLLLPPLFLPPLTLLLLLTLRPEFSVSPLLLELKGKLKLLLDLGLHLTPFINCACWQHF